MAVTKRINNNKGNIYLSINVISLFASAIFLLLCQTLYGQTLGELNTTMAVEEELRRNEVQPAAPKQATSNAEQPGMDKLDKAAQKLLKAMQSGVFDRADFSPAWDALVPKDTNFSAGINTICKPVFDQLGKPEKLGPGQMVGPNMAVFPLQCARGALAMTVSLDPQEKIHEWTLTPAAAAAQPPVSPTSAIPQTQEFQAPAAEQLTDSNMLDIKDFNSFQRELNRINIESKSEEEQWLGPIERKSDLAKAMGELATAELRFIRKLAESEKAEQTIKAIDLVLKQRQERLNNLTTKLDEELRNDRQQQAIERRPRRTTRATEGQEQPEQRPVRERPQRRTREPATDGQQYQP